MLVLPDLAILAGSEGSAGELPWTCYAWRLLDRVEFGRARWFSIKEGAARSSAIWFHQEISYSMVKSEAENVMKAKIGELVLVIIAYGAEEFAWSFGIRSSGV